MTSSGETLDDWAGSLTVGLGWFYYDGPVGHTEFHRHYAVQICFPFSGPLQIETLEKSQRVENVLVIGSNVSHRLSGASPTAKLLYIEPNLITRNTARLVVATAVVLNLPAPRIAIIEKALGIDPQLMESDFGRQVIDLIWPEESDGKLFSRFDPRITKALAAIEEAEDLNLSLGEVVGSSGLSPSRFRHLFSAQVGMSLKSYLLWSKLQRAVQSLATNSSLTAAAHAAGFADSAHLSRTFRRTFGLAPVDLSKRVRFTTPEGGS